MLIHQDHDGPVGGELGLRVLRVGADDQQVLDHGLAGRRAVQADRPAAPRGADGVGGEALAIGDVVDLDVLEFGDSRGLEQQLIDSAGALVVEVRFGDPHAVKLGLKEGLDHRGSRGGVRKGRGRIPEAGVPRAPHRGRSRCEASLRG